MIEIICFNLKLNFKEAAEIRREPYFMVYN